MITKPTMVQWKVISNSDITTTQNPLDRYYEHATEVSKYIWKLKDLEKTFSLKWSIAAYASSYRCGTRRCDLCITEKYIIAMADQKSLLKNRTKFIFSDVN